MSTENPGSTDPPADDEVMSDNPLLLSPREVTVELYRPGVEQQIEHLDAEIEKLEAARAAGGGPAKKQGRVDPVMKLAQQRDDLAANASRLVIVLREPLYDDTAGLYEQHPPRDGNRVDQRVGYNTDGYATALVRLCIVSPVVDDAQFAAFRASVSAFNWSKLTTQVHALVNQEPDLPKPLAVSALQRTRELASQPQRGTGSRRAASQA